MTYAANGEIPVIASGGTKPKKLTDWFAFIVGGSLGQVLTSNGSGADPSWATPTLSKSFTSSDQTITSGGALTIAHGLGVVPSVIQTRLVCQTGENGYTAGDVLVINVTNAMALNRGLSMVLDSTNLNVRYGSDAAAFDVLNKTTGTAATITNANWKLRLMAWA